MSQSDRVGSGALRPGATRGPDWLRQYQAPWLRGDLVAGATLAAYLVPSAIGTASLAYGQGSKVFGLGAATGSLVWFVVLGTAAFWLGRRLNSLKVWRALDGLVALMMWGTALWLLSSLF